MNILLSLSVMLLGWTSISLAATQQAVLTWTDVGTTETGYVIERKVGSTGTYAQVGTVAANIVTFTDAALVQGTNYCWHVIATGALGNGPPSDDACMVTAGVQGKVGGVSVILQLVP